MAKLVDLPLEDLYAKPKITSTVANAIMLKEDFSSGCARWCEKVCTLKCKNPPSAAVLVPSDQVDILIIQTHDALPDVKFGKSGERLEKKNREIIHHLMSRAIEQSSPVRLPRFAVTNLTKCQIQAGDLVKGKAPSSLTLNKCRPYLLTEIAKRKPKVIVTLNTEATKALGSKHSNTRGAGEISWVEMGGEKIPLVTTLHPKILIMLRQNSSGAFWGPDFYRVIIRDFCKAINLLEGNLRVPLLDKALADASGRIKVCKNLIEVRKGCAKVAELAAEGAVISFDTETTSLDRYWSGAKVITIQFGWRNNETGKAEAVVIPLWHRKNVWYNPDVAWKYVVPLLINPEVMKIGHNAKFDITYIATTTGVRVKGLLLDTMLLLHSLESGVQGMYGLKKAVHDRLPSTELGGYEDKLPKLTKPKKKDAEVESDEEDEES